jgi:MoxR-like ATPase
LVKAFGATLGCTVRRIQFTPDLLPADITGTYVLNPRDGTFALRSGPVFANVVLADEINRAPAKTQSALLEAMQERQVTIEGDRYELPNPFLVLATQNPIDLEGTYALPEAQIDRFLVRIRMGYPSQRDEVAMLRAHNVVGPEPSGVLSVNDVLQIQSIAARVHVEEDIREYAVMLSIFTRTHSKVTLGASPRATLSLVRAAKANAVVAGRPYATPDDIRAVAEPVLAHRLVLVPELEGDAQARSAIVEEALAKVGYRRAVRPV